MHRLNRVQNRGQNILFSSSEYGHVAYQIKGDEAKNNMQANILPLHISLTLRWVKRSNFFFVREHVIIFCNFLFSLK